MSTRGYPLLPLPRDSKTALGLFARWSAKQYLLKLKTVTCGVFLSVCMPVVCVCTRASFSWPPSTPRPTLLDRRHDRQLVLGVERGDRRQNQVSRVGCASCQTDMTAQLTMNCCFRPSFLLEGRCPCFDFFLAFVFLSCVSFTHQTKETFYSKEPSRAQSFRSPEPQKMKMLFVVPPCWEARRGNSAPLLDIDTQQGLRAVPEEDTRHTL